MVARAFGWVASWTCFGHAKPGGWKAGRPQGRAGQAGETMSPGWPGRKRQGGLSFPAKDTAPLTLTLTTTRIAKVCKHSNYFAF